MSETFSLKIAEFARKAGANADLVVRKVVLDVGKSVVAKSPVDTGRFRANWQHSVGDFAASTTQAIDPTGTATLGALTESVASLPGAGVVHYLTNSLPYAIRLENGYSKQAPAGMVGLTVVEYQSFVDAAVAGLPR